MNAVIADDEPHLIAHLRVRLARLWPELEVLATADNGLAAIEAIESLRPDIAFLDIRMPGASGLEVARRVRELGIATRVVFVTAFDEHAVDAFERDAVDYLLKPVSDERLAHAIAKLRRGSAPSAVAVDALVARLTQQLDVKPVERLRWIRASKRVGGEEVIEQIPVSDVLYFEADDKYTCVVTKSGESLIRVPLSELGDQLNREDFVQIHRSVIVNLHAVARTRRDLTGKLFVCIRDHPRELPVARQYAPMFRQM